MKATLVHNPTSGTGEHIKEGLIELLNGKGFEINYVSSKNKDIEKSLKDCGDLIIVAGGDGTIAEISTLVLDSNVPLAILALGTANNIAFTMQSCGLPEEQVDNWNFSNLSDFHTGTIRGSWGESLFFESIGFGVFPKLIEESKKRQESSKIQFKNRKEKIDSSLKVLRDIISEIVPSFYEIELDEEEVLSGEFLAVEVMNIKSLGPNIFLAPEASPADSFFDIVLISEEDRTRFLLKIESLLKGENPADIRYDLKQRKAGKIKILTNDRLLHIDDETEEINTATKVEIKVQGARLKFV